MSNRRERVKGPSTKNQPRLRRELRSGGGKRVRERERCRHGENITLSLVARSDASEILLFPRAR